MPNCNPKEYVIRSDHERDFASGDPLFWSVQDGWVDRIYADTFAENEKDVFDLPISGEWIEVE